MFLIRQRKKFYIRNVNQSQVDTQTPGVTHLPVRVPSGMRCLCKWHYTKRAPVTLKERDIAISRVNTISQSTHDLRGFRLECDMCIMYLSKAEELLFLMTSWSTHTGNVTCPKVTIHKENKNNLRTKTSSKQEKKFTVNGKVRN